MKHCTIPLLQDFTVRHHYCITLLQRKLRVCLLTHTTHDIIVINQTMKIMVYPNRLNPVTVQIGRPDIQPASNELQRSLSFFSPEQKSEHNIIES